MNLTRAREVADRGIGRHAYTSVDVALSYGGAEPVEFQLGAPTERTWTCASKCLLALAVAVLVSGGKLSYDSELGRYLPELSGSGWDTISLRAVLSHSVSVTTDIGALSVFLSDREVLERCAATPPDPAGIPTYTQWTSAFLTGQVIERVTGGPHVQLLREVAHRAGLRDTCLCYPRSRLPRIAAGVRKSLAGGQPTTPPVSRVAGRQQQMRVREDRCWAGISGSGPVSDLVRVLGALIQADDGGNALVSRAVAREVVTVHRPRANGRAGDEGLAWGLGVAVDQRLASPKCSSGTFGHFGQDGTVLVFADPAQGLVAGLSLTGARSGLPLTLGRAALVDALLADVQADRSGTQKPNSASRPRSQPSW